MKPLPDPLQPATRLASIADADFLWEWANDVETRRWSFQPAPIPWEAHVVWLETRLADPLTRIFVVSADGVPRAVVRYESDATGIAVVSIVVDPAARGRGWGTQALLLTCPIAALELAIERVDAFIMPGNAGSIKAFERAGFVRAVESGEPSAVRLVWAPDLS